MSRRPKHFEQPGVVTGCLIEAVRQYLGASECLWPNRSAGFMARDPCVYCGKPADTWDHIDPVIRGGTGSATNAARACERCNKAKGGMTVLVYLATREETKSGKTRHDITQRQKASKRDTLFYNLTLLLANRATGARPP